MKLVESILLPIVLVSVASASLWVSAALSADLCQNNSAVSSDSKTTDPIVNTQVIPEGQVLLVQTRSKGVELLREAKVVIVTKNLVFTLKDNTGKVIRVFRGIGRRTNLVAIATMTEAEAIRLLAAGSGIIEPE